MIQPWAGLNMTKKIKTPLNQAVPEYLNNFELNEDQLNKLHALETNSFSPKTSVFKYAAMIAVCIVTLYFSVGQYQNKMAIYAIVEEVSQNHLKFKPLEVSDKNLLKVSQYFEKLDFNPIQSVLVEGLNTQLLGGRYCSIQGNIAAQLRLQEQGGSLTTLFETKFNEDDFLFLPNIDKGEQPIRQFIDGQTVTLWIERGVVMALVGAHP